jgi:hypothetical protein
MASERVSAAKEKIMARVADDELRDALEAAYEAAIDPIQAQLDAEIDANATTLFTLYGMKTMIVTYHTPPTTTTTTTSTTSTSLPETTPPSTAPAEEGNKDAFCAKMREPNPGLQSGNLATMGAAGVALMTALTPLAPPEMVQHVAVALDVYTRAATGQMLSVVQVAAAASSSIYAMAVYCGITGGG